MSYRDERDFGLETETETRVVSVSVSSFETGSSKSQSQSHFFETKRSKSQYFKIEKVYNFPEYVLIVRT